MSQSNYGHGMGLAPEPKDWKHLQLEDIRALQHFYPTLQGEIEIVWHSPRPFSSAARIKIDEQLLFIKRSHCSFRGVDDLEQEHAFIAHLAQKGLQVPDVIAHPQGTALQIGEWVYEVHAQADAIDLYVDQLSWKPFLYTEHAAQAGMILAKFHQAASTYRQKQKRHAQYLIPSPSLLEQPCILDAIHDRIAQSQGLRHYFKKQIFDPQILHEIARIHACIHAHFVKLPPIWTHNDLHASNLLWEGQGPNAKAKMVIDFGLCNLSSAAYDLAIAVERNFIDWLNLNENQQNIQIDEAGLQAFLSAYAKTRLDHDALKLLPQLLQIVHVDFALSELEYFVEITKNPSHADAAYWHWLVSHTQWFMSQKGQHFIQGLERMVETLIQRSH